VSCPAWRARDRGEAPERADPFIFLFFENGQLPPDVPSTTPLRLYRQTLRWYILPFVAYLETLMAKQLKKKRDEAKQAWESATAVMKKAMKADDFMGSKRAHDESEKLRVEYLKAERASEIDSDDENTLAMSAHR
jgi:hypothetical protein